jgi:NAD(P)-dependent dehydrogenase (short-subunit alcohol dehydrogenase family)
MVSPGYLENSIDLPKEMQQLPMGRTAALSEVAALVCYLLSPAGKYITGQNIEVAGGVKL